MKTSSNSVGSGHNELSLIVRELLATGLTQQELAEMASTGQSYISAISTGVRGKRVGLKVGMKLFELHECLCSNSPKRPAKQKGAGK